jgi:ABC-type polysaccharide/polyol phosphate export permease
LAVWGLYYRNLQGVIQNLIRLWFYLTPIIWTLDRLKGRPNFQTLVKLNPLTGIIDAYRGAIMFHKAPDYTLAYSAGFSIVVLALGSWYFVRREQQFGKLV